MRIEREDYSYFNGEAWIKQKFIKVGATANSLSWLKENYGKEETQRGYWVDWNDVIMSERIYIHWALSE